MIGLEMMRVKQLGLGKLETSSPAVFQPFFFLHETESTSNSNWWLIPVSFHIELHSFMPTGTRLCPFIRRPEYFIAASSLLQVAAREAQRRVV